MKTKALLVPLLGVSLLFSLAACGDNYKEATAEQKTALNQRLQEVEDASEEKNYTGYKVSGYFNMSVSTPQTSINSNNNFVILTDDSRGANNSYKYSYISGDISGVSHVDAKIYEVEASDTFYIDYNYVNQYSGSVSAKVVSSGEHYDSDLESLRGYENLSSLTSILDRHNMDYSIREMISYLNDEHVTVYLDGENKIKIVYTYSENFIYNFYLTLDDDDNYTIKLEYETSSNQNGNSSYAKYSFLMEPTTETVTLPDISEYTPISSDE